MHSRRPMTSWEGVEPPLTYLLTLFCHLLQCLNKEPEMLQTDAFCQQTMQQNVTAVGALSLAPLGSSPDHLGG